MQNVAKRQQIVAKRSFSRALENELISQRMSSLAAAPYWALCRGKQTVGYMLGVEQAHTPPHPTPPPPHPKSTTLDSRWAAHRGLGPNGTFCIEVAAFCVKMLQCD